jgi:putative spermidine/putrescine transport system permease protein
MPEAAYVAPRLSRRRWWNPQARVRVSSLAPISALYLLFLLGPLSFFLVISFFRYSAMEMYVPVLTLDNYTRFLFDAYYQGVLLTTLRIGAVTTVICVLLGYGMALYLARYPTRWQGVLMFLIIAPLMSGVIVRTYAWILLLARGGPVNQALVWMGLVGAPVEILHTETAGVIALVHILLPYAVFPIYSAIAMQDRDLDRAAYTLGASRLRGFFEITLPLSRPGVIMGSVLVFTLATGAVVTPSLLGGKSVQTLGMTVYSLVVSTLNWPLAAAFASILVLAQFGLVLLYLGRSRDPAEAAQ